MKCVDCDQDAMWVRCTQFAGDHPFCLEHAVKERDWGTADSCSFWMKVEQYQEKKMTPIIPRHPFRDHKPEPEQELLEAEKEDILAYCAVAVPTIIQQASDSHIRILEGVCRAIMDGKKIRVEITGKKR